MLRPNDTLGPYTLLRPLGRGGFGEVWLAERRSSLLTTQVALKLPNFSEGIVDAIGREARTWLRASGHTNIVPVLDAEIYDGQVAIASEYIAGGTLAEWLAKHGGEAPAYGAAVNIAEGILAGLAHLHANGLAHRDLKPGNVMLQGGIPRITDFGLTRLLDTRDLSGNVSGTPRYMAPETFSGAYSPASDLWAAGVILYEMLSGRVPFDGPDLMRLLFAIHSEPPAMLPENVPARLQAVVTRLLSKRPEERFDSADEARTALMDAVVPSHDDIPLMTVPGGGASRPHNLPLQTTSFIGREREMAEVKARLALARLLTLTGSGGCGKTRLTLKVAEELLPDYPDGVWLIELAPLADPTLVPLTAAHTLGIAEKPDRPVTQTLLENLKTKRILLILDNCEHLLDASARLADALLHGCPGVTILASSREGLNIAGEVTYRIPSLELPPELREQGRGARQTAADALAQYDAVRLFCDRAAAYDSKFAFGEQNAQAVTSICRRLDGIPLAIELAASRLRSLTVEDLNRRMDDRFRLLTGGSRTVLPRQQTLRALIDWSYSLLTEPEKRVLCRLSVFVGGWTLEAAEEVAADRLQVSEEESTLSAAIGAPAPNACLIESWEILDLLTALLDKSLVTVDTSGQRTRYRMLETVRQYARDRLVESGEAQAWRLRHRDWFLAFITERRRTVDSNRKVREELEEELDNLRVAIDVSLSDPMGAETGLRMVGGIFSFLSISHRLNEKIELCVRALDAAPPHITRDRAWVLLGAANGSALTGRFDDAIAFYEESLRIQRALDNPAGIALALFNFGYGLTLAGQLERARTLLTEGLALAQQERDAGTIAGIQNNLGVVMALTGEPDAAESLLQEAHRTFVQTNMAGSTLEIDTFLGRIAQARGDLNEAEARYRASLETSWRENITNDLLIGPYCMADLARVRKQYVRSARLYGAHDAERELLGMPLPPAFRQEYTDALTELRAAMGDAEFQSAYNEGFDLAPEAAMEMALAHE